MILNSRLLKAALVILACAVTATYAQQKPSQLPGGYPKKPIRVLLGVSTGGGADAVTRIVARKLSERLGQSVIVDNRPGAATRIAMDLAAVASPDGYTLLSGSKTMILNGAQKKVSYDILSAYEPIAKMTTQMYILVTSLSIKSVKELIAYAKSKPGAVNYSSTGIGSVQHVYTELFKLMAGVNMVHVPYRGGATGFIGLLSGETQIVFASSASPEAQVNLKSGRVRAIAVTGLQRMQTYPDLPTVSESGVPGFEMTNMYGLLAPAGTGQAIIAALNREVSRIMTLPELKNTLAVDGVEAATPSTPGEFKDFIATELNKLEKFFRESKLKL